MAKGYLIRKNEYYDSVFLMRVARTISDEPGVKNSAVVMATATNKTILEKIGFGGGELDAAGANDLVVAVEADETAIVDRLLASIGERLKMSASDEGTAASIHSIDEAARSNPSANLVVISVPGDYAAHEARTALELGKHVFLFSDNVPLEQEVDLKQFAGQQGLLVMGPDCGTSLIGGVGIGFANVVRRGPVGVVGAAGTGLQEFTSMVHQAGSGISHAIGTGSHDLSEAVGGITTLMGLEALEADPGTKVIAIISKPAAQSTLIRLMGHIRTSRKPVVACFLGQVEPLEKVREGFVQAGTIDQAVSMALELAGVHVPAAVAAGGAAAATLLAREASGWLPEQRWLRGLFAGGTFCYQAQQVLREGGFTGYSNAPLGKNLRLENPEQSREHCLIDLGDDYFTRGRPHPMIDAGQRRLRILKEGEDPSVAVLLLDFILGHISSPDPAGDLVDAIRQARAGAVSRGGYLPVVASICGTDQDPQGLERQKTLLQDAGVICFASNAAASRFCRDLISLRNGGRNGK